MHTQSAEKSVEQIIAGIEALDLEPIKFKLMDTEEGQGWSREYTDKMEVAYKRFLTLVVKYPEEAIAPSKDIDNFWHGHILDTMKYAEDCEHVFGYFLHHFPYFGLRGAQDAANLAAASARTKQLYEEEFGQPMRKDAVVVCAAAVRDRAVCAAAVQAEAAVCAAALQSDVAVCAAAKPANDSAVCAAARKLDGAVCAAAVQRDVAVCAAAKRAKDGAVCAAAVRRDQLNTSIRPKLAMAA